MSQLKVLVVDDTISYLNSISEILQMENYQVISANDAQSAWKLFQQQNPDLVLLDVNLSSNVAPGENGLWLTTQIRQQGIEKSWCPILLMSSQATTQDQLDGYESGCDDYLIKPFDPRLMLAKLAVFARILLRKTG